MTINKTELDIDLGAIPSPCFVLDEKKLIKNLELLQKIRKDAGIDILCAFKGYAMWSTFPLLRKYLSGATASSLHEAQLCHEQWGKKAHLCAPVYTDEEIGHITDISSHITFNSLSQFQRFGALARNKNLEIALRINPEYSEVETDLYNPCVPGSRLGITAQDLPETLPDGVRGLHFHALCEQNSDTLARLLAVVEEKFDKHLRQVKWLNIGGGHHFTRKDYDIDLFVNTIHRFKQKYQIDIIAEPGEAIGWQTGYLVSTVRDVVSSNGFHTAMLDVSFSAHMPDCLEMPYQPGVYGTIAPDKNSISYRLGGHTCLAGDFMSNFNFPQALQIGDKIVFDDMIHYTMVKTNTFNGVKLPSIGIWKKEGHFELVREFGYEDYKGRLS
ncbi:MAG: carboxynorspermidine decarboxylase [Cyclobacteriaceae bacterium]|nr:carboxynorspermidine decarboxylase [Cyclobacteriaceae bacterium]